MFVHGCICLCVWESVWPNWLNSPGCMNSRIWKRFIVFIYWPDTSQLCFGLTIIIGSHSTITAQPCPLIQHPLTSQAFLRPAFEILRTNNSPVSSIQSHSNLTTFKRKTKNNSSMKGDTCQTTKYQKKRACQGQWTTMLLTALLSDIQLTCGSVSGPGSVAPGLVRSRLANKGAL